MTRSPLRSGAGFTYIAALVMVVIMGIMLSQGAQYWTTRMQREREAELIFRGRQVRDGLRRRYGLTLSPYGSYLAPGAPPPATVPVIAIPAAAPRVNELKDLLQASDSAGSKHYLRPSSLTVQDPVSGKKSDWELFKDPATQRITGVFLKSDAVPIKQANFPYDLDPGDFEGKKKYSDWVFICTKYPKPASAAGGATGLGGSATTGNSGAATPPGGSANPSGSPAGKTGP